MRKIFLLLTGFGSGFAVFLLLIANMTRPPENFPTMPPRAAGRPPFGVQKVEYIQPADIVFPRRIPGTDLTAERIVLYEGGYLEDNSNEEVVDIAGLEVYNSSEKIINSVKVVLERDGTSFTFRGSYIPPQSSVLLLEADRKMCPFLNFTGCKGWQRIENDPWIDQKDIGISPISMGAVRVTNLTDQTLCNIMLYYKNFLPYTEIYVGGITRKESIRELKPGESTELHPQYYARDYSRFLGVSAKISPEV